MGLGLSEHSDWFEWIQKEGYATYLNEINDVIANLRYSDRSIFPSNEHILRAWDLTPKKCVKIVILGQDPYHGKNQANGLAFSVNRGMPIPPSLKNVFKEIKREYPNTVFEHGDLESWARQGVFLLNSILTVEEGKPLSHKDLGWETFTKATIQALAQSNKSVVFMIWGSNALKILKGINLTNHLVLTSSHPSPLSVYRGFEGCGHFKQANDWLVQNGLKPIDWSIR